jgi:hypothetical protein
MTVNLSIFAVSSSSEEIPKMFKVLGSSFTDALRKEANFEHLELCEELRKDKK